MSETERDPSAWWRGAPPVVQRVWAREEVASIWWVWLLHGAVAVVAGVLLLAWPDRTLLLVGLILGIYLIVFGVIEVARAFAMPHRLAMERMTYATVGLLAVAAGTVAIERPSSSVLAVALAVGIYMIVAGLAAAVTAIREPGTRLPRVLLALVNIVAGIIVIVWPDVSVTVIAVVFGIALLLRGLAEVAFSIYLVRSRR